MANRSELTVAPKTIPVNSCYSPVDNMSPSSSVSDQSGPVNPNVFPCLIGVAGGTASGKSTVCQKIVELLGEDEKNNTARRRVEVISQESFYRQLSEKEQQLAEKGMFDFDHPSAFDEKLMIQTISDLKAGKTVRLQQYDYVHHRGNWHNSREIHPADVILFEGILIFYFKEIREACNMKLFVDTDADTRLSRRVTRDMAERGRTLETVLSQYTNFVKPAFEEFCLPTKKYADVIIPRGADNNVAIDLIVQHIKDVLRHDPNQRPVALSPFVASELMVSNNVRPH